MRVIAGSAERGPTLAAGAVLAALSILAFTTFAGLPVFEVSTVVLLTVVFAVAYKSLLSWRFLIALLIVVILFIPMRRYTLPAGLPFELEPYRLFVALVAAGWIASLLADPRVRLRASGFEGPLILFVAAALGSIVVNPTRVSTVDAEVVKQLMFLASFLVVFYLIVSVVRTVETLMTLLRVLVIGGAVVAFFAIIESRTGFNPFNRLANVLPLIEPHHVPELTKRGARLRVFASAQHPIALGAALVLIIPLAVYLARTLSQRRWWAAAALLGVGALAPVARTSILMLGVVALVFLWLRPQETKRLWPFALPMLLVIHFAMPGTIGTLRSSFFPEGGLIAEQQISPGGAGSGRLVDIEQSLGEEFVVRPVLGQGYGTRVVDAGRENAIILDNQWLATLLETGIVGAAAFAWLFVRFLRRVGREAKQDQSARGWLLTAIAASVGAYAVSMFTYDAFSFIQATFMLFILLGFGAAALRLRPWGEQADLRPTAT